MTMFVQNAVILSELILPPSKNLMHTFIILCPQQVGALVAQWVKRWPTDLVDRVRTHSR